jgi:Cu/Ag efflux protein CusF
MKTFKITALCLALAFGTPTLAQDSASLTDGEVRRVDKEARKITLRHGPIANLDMPGMTMVFQVSDPAVLDKVKVGDKVRFSAEKVNGQFTVNRLEPAQP